MRDDRITGVAAVALATLALVLGWAAPAASQVARSEEVYRLEALGHADAVMRAYRRLEQHIREESTALTDGSAWVSSIPPAATGWLADWTQRGVRARYCDDTLLVYVDAARLKGVGADHRSVQVALRVYAPGRNRGPTGPGLHWLENGIVRDVGGSAVVPLPGCLTTPALPSGRAAFAGRVRDPFATANLRQRRSTEVMNPPQACAVGEHGTGRTMFRDVVETLNDRNEAVGSPAFGVWQVLVDGCRADYTVTERFTRTCSWQAGPPHNRTLTGVEVWQRTKTVTQAGEVYGTPSMVSTSCWNGDGTGGPLINAALTLVDRQETRSVGCPPGYSGSHIQRRTVTERTAEFPWDASPVETVRETNWVTSVNTCTPPLPPQDPPEDPKDPPEDPKDPPEDPQDPPEDPQDPPEDPKDPPEDPKDPAEDPEDPPHEKPGQECGADETGTWPNCVKQQGKCRSDQTGTWPHCVDREEDDAGTGGESSDEETVWVEPNYGNVYFCINSCGCIGECEGYDGHIGGDEVEDTIENDPESVNYKLIQLDILLGNDPDVGDDLEETVQESVDNDIQDIVDTILEELGDEFIEDIVDNVVEELG